MDYQSHYQPAPAPARRAACSRGLPRGSKNRPRTQLEGSHANTQASQGASASQPLPASQARTTSLNPRQKSLSRPATKVSYTRVTRNSEVTYTFTVYSVVTKPCTLNPRVATSAKGSKTPAISLHSLNDLAYTVDERFVLAYPADPLPLVAPSWEETLVNLDYLLAWCCPLLKTIRASQSEAVTLTLNCMSEFQMTSTFSSQSDTAAEIRMKPSSLPAPAQQSFVSSQLDSEPTVM
ncbi:hypothetical protein DSO57_1007220 [Entomophthora muscae]|uniref:Uncharacterized protein n=1 Tax=Entomophthora muscae TaxID=34485 RepID=A0ACC2TJE5_9FUNG|nr:hypothetical protein DSO57_1007220 [Entomophthora muscae]